MTTMTTKSTEEWLDCFWVTVEVMAESLADRKKMERMTKTKLVGPLFDLECLQHRRALWKRVRKKFIGFGLECCDDLSWEGARPLPSGDWVVTGPLKVYHTEDSVIPVVFEDDEAQLAMNFISFLAASLTKGVKPEVYVRSVLREQGIDSYEAFEANRDKFLIENPFTP